MSWKNININTQNIEAQSDKATLIKMPNNSIYKGWSFWHTNKLVRDGKNSYSISIGYNDDFTFRLVKYGHGKWNKRQVLNETTISVEEFEEAFEVMNENIKAPKPKYIDEYETHKPKQLEARETDALDELKDE